MELAAPIWDAIKCLWDCSTKHAAVICDLEDNLQSLTDHWTQLQKRSVDVNAMVQQAESNPHMGRTEEVDYWLQRVNDFQETIEDTKKRGAKIVQDKCLGKFCHKNCLSSYNFGKEVVKTVDHVKQLKAKGDTFNSTNIAKELPRNPAEEMAVPKTIGMDVMLKRVWDSIEEKTVGIIGLYGMGGAGKTTLLKKVNNELASRRHDFALVIWVEVSKKRDIDKIIDEIYESININWKGKSRDGKVREIYNVLKQKKFLLLLDDIWETLDLDIIGVPPPNETNQSKVLFTTRFKSVCEQMQAKKFEVKCLTEKEAFDLFCMKVGEETIHSDTIRTLAQQLVQECKGLPLALITIGRAMAGRKNPDSWNHAIMKLKSSPSEVKGIEEEVFAILKFSYDSLSTATEKDCFLYLALFPENKLISIRDLILLWIGEGLLSEHDSIAVAFNHGQDLVESFMLACLVEGQKEDFIKVHDLIRDMALWLLRDQDRNKKRILVQDEALKSLEGENLENWKIVERISMMMSFHHKGFQTWNLPCCPHLVTLIVEDNLCIKNLANIRFMSELKVLSLKRIEGITTLPTELGSLIHLEYLEISQCGIKEKFPIELKNLMRLKIFIVNIDSNLEIIPLEVISCLERLKVFEFKQIASEIIGNISIHLGEELFLEQLELLPHLEYISINLVTPPGFNKLNSSKLQHCVRNVEIDQKGKTAIHTPIIHTPNSWEFSLVNHNDIFCKLSEVGLQGFHLITHLSGLKFAPHLRDLKIARCDLLEEVIMETEDNKDRENMDSIFANLKKMCLEHLPNLRSIYKKALPFPKLESISIIGCQNFKKLPFNSNSAKYLKTIFGEEEWWDNLEWEDPTIKDLFQPKFKTMVVLKMRLHCEGCIKKLRRTIKKVKGVESVDIDVAKELVIVEGKMNVKEMALHLKERLKLNVEVVSPIMEVSATPAADDK